MSCHRVSRRSTRPADIGHENWYDWSVANWGTKRNAVRAAIEELPGDDGAHEIRFDAAWSAPFLVNHKIAALFPQAFEIQLDRRGSRPHHAQHAHPHRRTRRTRDADVARGGRAMTINRARCREGRQWLCRLRSRRRRATGSASRIVTQRRRERLVSTFELVLHDPFESVEPGARRGRQPR